MAAGFTGCFIGDFGITTFGCFAPGAACFSCFWTSPADVFTGVALLTGKVVLVVVACLYTGVFAGEFEIVLSGALVGVFDVVATFVFAGDIAGVIAVVNTESAFCSPVFTGAGSLSLLSVEAPRSSLSIDC